MENLHVSLKLEERSPRFARADVAGVSDLVEMPLLDVDRHFAAALEFVSADITIPIFVWRQYSVGLFVGRKVSFALQDFSTNRTRQVVFTPEMRFRSSGGVR